MEKIPPKLRQLAITAKMPSYPEPDDHAELILFGSRADDSLKGGDIDLLLKISSLPRARALRQQAHEILAAIKKRVGEQRIDLSIKAIAEVEGDPFWAVALGRSVRLI